MSIENPLGFSRSRKNGSSQWQHNLKKYDMVFSPNYFIFQSIKKDILPSDICGM